MMYRMDDSFRHHPLCLCHEDGNGDDTPRHDIGELKEGGEESLDVMVVPTITRTIIP